jgi:hypothetical protein
MSSAISPDPVETLSPERPAPRRRPLGKRVMMAVRRAHLYAGLFLLPWVVLYGVTAFLFNHPTAFADQPARSFGRSELRGTPLESPPAARELAAQVVAALQARAPDGTKYALVEPERAKFTREFAFATVKADGHTVSLLFDAAGGGGSIRSKADEPVKVEEKAAFAVGPGKSAPKGGPARGPSRIDGGVFVPDPLHERVAAAVPAVLERTGFPPGEVTVTSVPDVSFRMSDGEKVWTVTHNPQTGAVSGKGGDDPGEPLSARRFLLRLHTAHGYPGAVNAKWAWCAVVDAMAFVMVFWGLSGLLMWWQVKATRRWGAVVVVLSAAAAAWLAVGMHDLLTGR